MVKLKSNSQPRKSMHLMQMGFAILRSVNQSGELAVICVSSCTAFQNGISIYGMQGTNEKAGDNSAMSFSEYSEQS